MGKIKLNHNLTDAELEDYLEKALKGIKSYEDDPKTFDDPNANSMMLETQAWADKVLKNMVEEIKQVVSSNK